MTAATMMGRKHCHVFLSSLAMNFFKIVVKDKKLIYEYLVTVQRILISKVDTEISHNK